MDQKTSQLMKNLPKTKVDANGEVVEVKEEKFSPIKKKYITPCGQRMQPTYKKVYNEKLKREVVVRGEDMDIYEFIQMSASNSDIEMFKREALKTGIEANVLPGAVYGVDTSMFPKDIHQLYRLANNSSEIFNGFDEQTKAAFKDVSDFNKCVLDGSAQERIRSHFSKLAEEAVNKAKLKEKEGE